LGTLSYLLFSSTKTLLKLSPTTSKKNNRKISVYECIF